jgi:Uma2 family endonuclease
MDSFVLQIPDQDRFTEDEFFRFCEANRDLRIERDENGQIIIMSPVGSSFSNKNFKLVGLFFAWLEQNPELGYGFDSSSGFVLPDKSMRSPDLSWVKKARWEALSREQQEKFAPICPDFVIELRSKSDRLKTLQDKMLKWIANGCELAWLIDPIEQKAYIYSRASETATEFSFDKKLNGGELLPGFELELAKLK